MGKKGILTKILAIVGTVSVWLPVLAPVLFSLLMYFPECIFRFDYLMPAELFPVAMIGGAALTWAALRARFRQIFFGGSFIIALCLLFGSQWIAVATGLATGEADPTISWRIIVLVMINVYSFMLVVLGVGGVLFVLNLFKLPQTDQDDGLKG